MDESLGKRILIDFRTEFCKGYVDVENFF